MKVNIKIIEKLKEESCTFYLHKITSFISDIVSILENNSDSYLIAKSTQKDREEKIFFSMMYYLEYLERKVFIYTEENIYETKIPLYKLEHDLPDHFVRISKTIIVNIHCLHQFTVKANGNLEALLTNGEKVVVSRKYVASLKKTLTKYSNSPLMY